MRCVNGALTVRHVHIHTYFASWLIWCFSSALSELPTRFISATLHYYMIACLQEGQLVLAESPFYGEDPCNARGRCRISPPRFLAESCKKRLNRGTFVSAVCLVVYFL